MSNLVRYNNDMNKVRFSNFKEKELDIFHALIVKMKYKETKLVTLTFEEIRELSDYKYKGVQRFYDDLDRLYKKMLELNLKYEDEKYIRRFVLFNYYEINKEKRTVKLSVNDQFEFILNNLLSNFTKFELEEFVSLKSIYSKCLFRLLKQWSKKTNVVLTIKDFRELLDIPEKYRMSEIDKKVLKPIIEELPSIFLNFKIKKIKTCRTISHIEFSWNDKKKKTQKQKPIIDIDKLPQQLSLLQAPKLETVETPRMDVVRQCIAEHPDTCPGHEDDALDALCAQARKYKK